MHNDTNISKTTKLDGTAILKHLEIMKVCSYVHIKLGRVTLHNHHTIVCLSLGIIYRSMLQRLPLENKTVIDLLDEAHVAVSHWRVQRTTHMAD